MLKSWYGFLNLLCCECFVNWTRIWYDNQSMLLFHAFEICQSFLSSNKFHRNLSIILRNYLKTITPLKYRFKTETYKISFDKKNIWCIEMKLLVDFYVSVFGCSHFSKKFVMAMKNVEVIFHVLMHIMSIQYGRHLHKGRQFMLYFLRNCHYYIMKYYSKCLARMQKVSYSSEVAKSASVVYKRYILCWQK